MKGYCVGCGRFDFNLSEYYTCSIKCGLVQAKRNAPPKRKPRLKIGLTPFDKKKEKK